ncbi:MAG: hypothetical protein R3E40_02800 [Rhodocyclaceae bacterium]
MDSKKTIVAYGFLQNAVPEAVFNWFEKNSRPFDANDSGADSGFPSELEQALLARKDKCIDLALATWGEDSFTAKSLYQRYCSPEVCQSKFPPSKFTYAHSILTALLAGRSAHYILFDLGSCDRTLTELIGQNSEEGVNRRDATLKGLSPSDFDGLIEGCDVDLLSIIHTNPWSGLLLLKMCANREGIYRRMPDETWLQVLMHLGRNPGLLLKDTTDSDGPDLRHSEIHDLFVQAIGIAPKTDYGASAVWGLLIDMPQSATASTYINLEPALQAWDTEIQLEPEGTFKLGCWSRTLADEDGMTPSERVRFHLLRHYYHQETKCDSTKRVHRLAAFTFVQPSDAFIDRLQRYADADGQAFLYATAFNSNIWKSGKAVNTFLQLKVENLKDMSEVHRIRESAAPNWSGIYYGESSPSESNQMHEIVAFIEATTKRIERQIRASRLISIWGMIALAVLVMIAWR